MNRTVVIFESRYGFTRRYAQWIGEALSCPVFEKKQFHPQNFSNYDTIIYGGGLYAGGVSGIKLIVKNWPRLSQKRLILFTCGLADPKDPANVSHIREGLSKAVPQEMLQSLHLFHLRGGIDYSRLSPVHKIMMSMLRKMLLKKEPDALTREDRQLLDTYGTRINLTDRKSIEPLVELARSHVSGT